MQSQDEYKYHDGVLQLPVIALSNAPSDIQIVGATGIRCPRCCMREIVYNGNYYCWGMAYMDGREPECGWALPHDDAYPDGVPPAYHNLTQMLILSMTDRSKPPPMFLTGKQPGVNTDHIDVEAGLAMARQCGYDSEIDAIVLGILLNQWRRGEESAAEHKALEYLNNDMTSWRMILAAARTGGEEAAREAKEEATDPEEHQAPGDIAPTAP